MQKKWKWAILCIVVLVLVIMCFSGCYYIAQSRTKKEHDYGNIHDVMRKQNVWMSSGQSAAVHDGRIYYLSQEGEKDGLYSMDTDGGDVRFELAAPKITRLIVTDDSFYYVGADEIDEGDTLYGLYRFERESGALQEIEYSNRKDCVYDAYVTADGTICVMDYFELSGSAPRRVLTFVCDDIEEYYSVELKKFEFLRRNEHMTYTTGKVFYGEFDNLISDNGCSFIDSATGTMVMDGTKLSPYDYRALYCESDRLWIAKTNELTTYDPDTFAPIETFVFEGDFTNEEEEKYGSSKAITFFFRQTDMVYVTVVQDENVMMWLCYLDPSTGENGEIAAFDEEKVLIDVSDDGMLWAQGNKIVCRALDGGDIGDILFEIEMPEDVVQDNILEVAGNWLFVHKKAQAAEAETNQLQYKVNLKTQEVID